MTDFSAGCTLLYFASKTRTLSYSSLR